MNGKTQKTETSQMKSHLVLAHTFLSSLQPRFLLCWGRQSPVQEGQGTGRPRPPRCSIHRTGVSTSNPSGTILYFQTLSAQMGGKQRPGMGQAHWDDVLEHYRPPLSRSHFYRPGEGACPVTQHRLWRGSAEVLSLTPQGWALCPMQGTLGFLHRGCAPWGPPLWTPEDKGLCDSQPPQAWSECGPISGYGVLSPVLCIELALRTKQRNGQTQLIPFPMAWNFLLSNTQPSETPPSHRDEAHTTQSA